MHGVDGLDGREEANRIVVDVVGATAGLAVVVVIAGTPDVEVVVVGSDASVDVVDGATSAVFLNVGDGRFVT